MGFDEDRNGDDGGRSNRAPENDRIDLPEGLSFVFLGMLGLLASIKLRMSYL